jgi:1-deoxy-D-xylulose-5-phosphate reductoisomerase
MTPASRGTEADGSTVSPVPGRPASTGSAAPVTVSLVGSTGSIGRQAIEVMEACPERFDVVALGAYRSVDLLVAQAARLRPAVVAIGDPACAPELAERLDAGVEVVVGTEGLAHIATLAACE